MRFLKKLSFCLFILIFSNSLLAEPAKKNMSQDQILFNFQRHLLCRVITGLGSKYERFRVEDLNSLIKANKIYWKILVNPKVNSEIIHLAFLLYAKETKEFESFNIGLIKIWFFSSLVFGGLFGGLSGFLSKNLKLGVLVGSFSFYILTVFKVLIEYNEERSIGQFKNLLERIIALPNFRINKDTFQKLQNLDLPLNMRELVKKIKVVEDN